MDNLAIGIYEQLLDQELQERINLAPELQAVLRKIDDEESPHAYALFVKQLLQQTLRQVPLSEQRLLLNRLIELLAAQDGFDYIARRKLLQNEKNILVEVKRSNEPTVRPFTPLNSSALLTGQGGDPSLEHELRAEMATADTVLLLVSFIKWSGLRLLMPAFEKLAERQVPVRIISTSYMGASDPAALEWLVKQPNIEIRLSYDTGGTRLHAKAYHFQRNSGFSTAYIGSANISHAAMTQGLEWTLKVTEQDLPHILERFRAEFETYWESHEFEPFKPEDAPRFRAAIGRYRQPENQQPRFFADITPRPFQQRILEAIAAARANNFCRNLVVAATGTGKTVIAALDYRRLVEQTGRRPKLLFVVHRAQILQQALECFRTVLRDYNFGELLVDGMQPSEWSYVFASVQSLNSQKPWEQLGAIHFEHIIVDEAHHGAAASYRPLFQHLQPKTLLGLTATPERMDGSPILPDFDGRMTAEIRLPEALAEKLLCPFHYFGVTDNIDLSDEYFWANGRYAVEQLDRVYTGDDIHARLRVDLIINSIRKYQPETNEIKGVGFCASVQHARYMCKHFNLASLPAAVIVGETPLAERNLIFNQLRQGKINFIFSVDVWSEGIDIPEMNMALFLRPTESLTVFLQQLGRGLRHAPGKECLTVLDFIGRMHAKYQLHQQFAALLSRNRQRLDIEAENDFPSLPPGCSIQLERVARERVLAKIKTALTNLQTVIAETIQTWDSNSKGNLTFGKLIEETNIEPTEVLRHKTWSEWKAIALKQPLPADPDLVELRRSLPRLALRNDPVILKRIAQRDFGDREDSSTNLALHYLLWNQSPKKLGMSNVAESFEKWQNNPSVMNDAAEIAAWRAENQAWPISPMTLPFDTMLQLHASYNSNEIKADMGLATIQSAGQTGIGVMHVPAKKCYIHLITFIKDESRYTPTTRYRDYPINEYLLHWQSQSTITRASATGQNYLHFKERNYTILFFARLHNKVGQETAPFIFLGPAEELISAHGDRPIDMVWRLRYPMPAALLEEAKPVL